MRGVFKRLFIAQKVVFVVLFCLLLLGDAGRVAAQPPTGHIQVESDPGLLIYLGDSYQGTSTEAMGGLIIQHVPAGEHVIRAEKEGYYSRQNTVSVVAGQVLVYVVEGLESQITVEQMGDQTRRHTVGVGTIVIQSLPVQCDIILGSQGLRQRKTHDILRLSNVPAGEHLLRFEGMGQALEQTLTLASNGTVGLMVNFIDGTVEPKEIVPEIGDVHGDVAAEWHEEEALSAVDDVETAAEADDMPAQLPEDDAVSAADDVETAAEADNMLADLFARLVTPSADVEDIESDTEVFPAVDAEDVAPDTEVYPAADVEDIASDTEVSPAVDAEDVAPDTEVPPADLAEATLGASVDAEEVISDADVPPVDLAPEAPEPVEQEGEAGQVPETTFRDLLDQVAKPGREGDEGAQTSESIVAAGIEFRRVPAGRFLMGSPHAEQDRYADEGRRVRVTIREEFWLGLYPVTQAQWQTMMGDAPSRFRGAGDLPVENISWLDCQQFIARLNARDEGTFRLPTEAEWEYAYRAGSQTRFYWGDDPDYGDINAFAWHAANSGGGTQPVGQKRPNAWGFYDMAGNVWEWCEDDWYEDYTDATTDGSARVSSPRSSARVVRGGSWNSEARNCRAATRLIAAAAQGIATTGLRLVYVPPRDDAASAGEGVAPEPPSAPEPTATRQGLRRDNRL